MCKNQKYASPVVQSSEWIHPFNNKQGQVLKISSYYLIWLQQTFLFQPLFSHSDIFNCTNVSYLNNAVLHTVSEQHYKLSVFSVVYCKYSLYPSEAILQRDYWNCMVVITQAITTIYSSISNLVIAFDKKVLIRNNSKY